MVMQSNFHEPLDKLPELEYHIGVRETCGKQDSCPIASNGFQEADEARTFMPSHKPGSSTSAQAKLPVRRGMDGPRSSLFPALR